MTARKLEEHYLALVNKAKLSEVLQEQQETLAKSSGAIILIKFGLDLN